MPDNENRKHLGFLIFPGFPMSCLTSAIEPLRAANEISRREAFSWTVVGETAQRVVSSAKVGFDPDKTLEEVTGIDQLYFLSGPSGAFADPRAANAMVRKLARHGTAMGGFSGGIFPLARTGLLSDHRASVHWCYEASLRGHGHYGSTAAHGRRAAARRSSQRCSCAPLAFARLAAIFA